MFTEAERTIHNLNRDMKDVNSRLSACENGIYALNDTVWKKEPIWDKIEDIEYNINSLAEKLATLQEEISILTVQLKEHISATQPDPDVRFENPNQKSHLEILEEKGYIDLEDVKNEKGIWELYDENWWNK